MVEKFDSEKLGEKLMLSPEKMTLRFMNRSKEYEKALAEFFSEVNKFYSLILKSYQALQGKHTSQKQLDSLETSFEQNAIRIFRDFRNQLITLNLTPATVGIRTDKELRKFAENCFSLINESSSRHLHSADSELKEAKNISRESSPAAIISSFSKYLRAFNGVHLKSEQKLPLLGQSQGSYENHFRYAGIKPEFYNESFDSLYMNTLKKLDQVNIPKGSALNQMPKLANLLKFKIEELLVKVEINIKKIDQALEELKNDLISSLREQTQKREGKTMRFLKLK